MLQQGNNPALLTRTREILTTTHSVENLDCTLALQAMIRSTNALGYTRTAALREGKQLLNEYILGSARRSVNINDGARERLTAAINALADEAGPTPSAAGIRRLSEALAHVRDELTQLMWLNIRGRLATPASADPGVSGGVQVGATATGPGAAGADKPSTSAEAKSAATSGGSNLLGLPDAQFAAFQEFLNHYKRLHFLGALEDLNNLKEAAKNLGREGGMEAFADQVKSFLRTYMTAGGPQEILFREVDNTELRKQIASDLGRLQSAATVDPEGLAQGLLERLAPCERHLKKSLERFYAGFQQFDQKSSPKGRGPGG
jgi:hypothetical protein